MTDQPSDNSDSILYRCAEIKTEMERMENEIKNLQKEYNMLKPMAIERVKELAPNNLEGKKKYTVTVGDYGTFTIAKYRKWKYSSIVDKLKIKMDEQMNHERADGTAIPEVTDILKFNVKKGDKNDNKTE